MQTIEPIDINALANLKSKDKYVMKVNKNDTYYAKIWSLNSSDPLGKYSFSGEVDIHNNFSGYGELIYHSNPIIKSYQGNFVNNEKSGNGVEVYTNNDIYIGEFKNNKKNGFGKLCSNNGIVKYSGNWSDDKIIGSILGYDYDPFGNKYYYGYMEDNKYNGLGVKLLLNKVVQIGFYVNGVPERKLDFSKRSTPMCIKIDDDLNVITKLYNNINNNMTIDNIKKIEQYLIPVNDNIKLKLIDDLTNNYYYSGDVKYDDKTDKYISHGNGEYIKDVENMTVTEFKFQGLFENNKFINGTISDHHNIIIGQFNEIQMDKLLNYADILKSINSGLLCVSSNESRSKGLKPTVKINSLCFEGSFSNGRLSEGILYGLSEKVSDITDITKVKKIKIYEGTFRSDVTILCGNMKQFHGFGTEYYQDGLLKYQGNYENGVYHGNGVLFHHENGAIQYCGSFNNGEKHGQGMLFDVDSNLVYDGVFTYDNIEYN